MDSGQSNLNPSSLLDLKAELHKRYESFQKAKVGQKTNIPRHTSLKRKGENLEKEKKPASAIKRTNEENNEEDSDLRKSRLALEAKAKLYEKITSSKILIDDEDSERYLVDFNRKVLYETPGSDVKGKAEDTNSKLSSAEVSSNSQPCESSKQVYSERPVVSVEEEKKAVEEKSSDGPIHYQDVRFNEVRDHGTSYFAFSTNEARRKEQMEELNLLRQQTEEHRLAVQKLSKKRRMLLEARLAKVCERRNIDKNVVKAYTAKEEAPEKEEQNVELSSIPLPEVPNEQEKKEVKVRPWDIGKTNFQSFVPGKNKTKTQNDWIEERRSERPSEFAPPSFYR